MIININCENTSNGEGKSVNLVLVPPSFNVKYIINGNTITLFRNK